jgi:hypothetical protein
MQRLGVFSFEFLERFGLFSFDISEHFSFENKHSRWQPSILTGKGVIQFLVY